MKKSTRYSILGTMSLLPLFWMLIPDTIALIFQIIGKVGDWMEENNPRVPEWWPSRKYLKMRRQALLEEKAADNLF